MAGSTENSLEAVEIVIVHIFDGIVVCIVGSWIKRLHNSRCGAVAQSLDRPSKGPV